MRDFSAAEGREWVFGRRRGDGLYRESVSAGRKREEEEKRRRGREDEKRRRRDKA